MQELKKSEVTKIFREHKEDGMNIFRHTINGIDVHNYCKIQSVKAGKVEFFMDNKLITLRNNFDYAYLTPQKVLQLGYLVPSQLGTVLHLVQITFGNDKAWVH